VRTRYALAPYHSYYEFNFICGESPRYASGPETFWLLGQIRDLISVRGPGYFVYWKNKKTKQKQITTTCAPSLTLYTGNAIYFICLETCLQCGLWNWFFCCILVVVFGSMLDAATRRVACVCASEILFRHLDSQCLILEMNCSQR